MPDEVEFQKLYDADYYAHGCGVDYKNQDHWRAWFGHLADRIVADFAPKTVLDAGCAMGYLVEALRERGVEAFGVDISEYAIENAREGARPYCRVGSVAEPFERQYDLIVSIEVLEHMPKGEAERAVANFCRHADDVLFSSTPNDYREATHFNVQPVEYWSEHYARHGFYRDIDCDASFLTPWACRYRRDDIPKQRLVRNYERRQWLLWNENCELRQLAVELQNQLRDKQNQLDAHAESVNVDTERHPEAPTGSQEIAEIPLPSRMNRLRQLGARLLPRPVKTSLKKTYTFLRRLLPETLKARIRPLIRRNWSNTSNLALCRMQTSPCEASHKGATGNNSTAFAHSNVALKPFGLNVVGYIRFELGIGQSARLCASSARAAKIPLAVIEHSGSVHRSNDYTFPADEIRRDNPYAFNLFHVNAEHFPGLPASLGPEFDMNAYNIGYWHWELPEFHGDWSNTYDMVNEVWVPSRFVADSIAEKSSVPVVRIPHAIGFNVSSQVSREKFGLPQNTFLFLCMYDMLSFQERKNPAACIEAFRRAFAHAADVTLVIKTQNADQRMEQFADLHELIADLPNTVIINATLSRQEIYELESVCDCYVSLHRSEGFGLGLAESMFLGKPTIGTNWSGNTDFMNAKNSCLVDYELVKLTQDYGPYKKGQQWADADIEHAAWHMRKLVNDQAFAKEIGEAGRQTIVSDYSYSAVGERYRRRLNSIVRLYGLQPESPATGNAAALDPAA